MPLLALLSILSGIAESHPWHSGPPVMHIIIAVAFNISLIIHGWLNRRGIIKYYGGIKRLLIPAGIIIAVSIVAIVT
jgi:hypothetical protein